MSEILELVDRLVATSNRMAVAEHDLADLTEQFHQLEDALSVSKERIAALEAEVANQKTTISYQYDERRKLEKELKAFKDKQKEDESYHTGGD